MSKNYVKVYPATTLKDASKCMLDSKQNCVIVVDNENLLEGILTYGDIRRYLSKTPTDALTGDAALEDVCGYAMLPFLTAYLLFLSNCDGHSAVVVGIISALEFRFLLSFVFFWCQLKPGLPKPNSPTPLDH